MWNQSMDTWQPAMYGLRNNSGCVISSCHVYYYVLLDVVTVCLAVYTDALRCFNCIGKDCRTGEIDCNNPTFRRKIASGGYGTVTPYCVNVTTPSGTS